MNSIISSLQRDTNRKNNNKKQSKIITDLLK